MALYLVTGGAGHIGSHLVEALVARNNGVRVFDDFSTGSMANLARVRDHIQVFAEELSNEEALARATEGTDGVFHFATPQSGESDSYDFTASSWKQPTDTLRVLLAARDAGVRRVVYASSGSVYTHANALQMKESDPIVPLSAYDFAKLTGEHQCIAFASLYGLETVRLRYFDVFGPRQCPSSRHAAAIPVIVKAMLAGQSPILLGNVHECRDYLYVDDAVHAALLAAEVNRASGKVYNIARGRSTSLLQAVAIVNEILHSDIKPVFTQGSAHDVRPQSVSVAKAEAELGFCPSVDFRQGLRAVIDCYKNHADEVALGMALDGAVGRPHLFRKLKSVPPGVTGESSEPGM